MRALLLVAAAAAGLAAIPASGWASSAAWQWIVLERITYVSAGPGTVSGSFVTDAIGEFPATMMAVPEGTAPDSESRTRVRVSGPTPASAVRLAATESCSDDTSGASARHSYTYALKPGRFLTLPGSPVRPPARSSGGVSVASNITCGWAFRLTYPVSGKGTHRLIVEVSASSPAAEVVSIGGAYQAEQCTVTVDSSGSGRSCEPLQ